MILTPPNTTHLKNIVMEHDSLMGCLHTTVVPLFIIPQLIWLPNTLLSTMFIEFSLKEVSYITQKNVVCHNQTDLTLLGSFCIQIKYLKSSLCIASCLDLFDIHIRSLKRTILESKLIRYSLALIIIITH